VIRTKDKPRVSCELLVPEVVIDISKVSCGANVLRGKKKGSLKFIAIIFSV